MITTMAMPGPRGRPPRRSSFNVWLLALIAIGGCAALGHFYWELLQKHKELKTRLGQVEGEANLHAGAKSRADRASAELARLRTSQQALEAHKLKLEEAQKFTAAELAQLREMKRAADERAAEFDKLRAGFKEMIASKVLEVERRESRMVVRMPAEVLFPVGVAELSEKGKIELYKLSAVLQKEEMRKKFRFMVAGHTDNTPIQASAESRYKNNWELSTARAVTVTSILVKAGINPRNLVAAGFGEFAPIASNKSRRGRARNRRIEIVLLPDVGGFWLFTEQSDAAE